MAYLNIDIDFLDHPKTKRLTGLLGRGSEVLLIRLWSYCGKFHCETGRLDGYSAQEVESLAGWWGKSGDMLQAMLKVGWMECDQHGTWTVHDWNEHQGHLQMFKERGRMMAQKRWNRPENACSNAASIPASNAPTVPTNQLREREEEDRPMSTRPDEADLPTEPPPGMPRSPEEAFRKTPISLQEALGRDLIAGVWEELRSTGWINRQGIVVREWSAHIKVVGPKVKAWMIRTQTDGKGLSRKLTSQPKMVGELLAERIIREANERKQRGEGGV